MKKRMLSLLLSLCLVGTLFAGMGATAWADGNTITYTMVQGDTVAMVCAGLGIDFAANEEWIMKTNGITDYSKLPVGRVLTLPKPGTVLKWVAPSTSTTASTTAATTPAMTTAAATTTAATSASSVPTITYKLVSGDSLIKVCTALGIDYKANEAWIMAANNISNPNAVAAGLTIILPKPGTTPALSTATANTAAATTAAAATATASSAGLLSGDTVASYLVNYVVKSNDTLFNICQAYGANMNEVQTLNSIKDPARIAIGKNLLIPTKTAPASGSFLKVVAHKVLSGETTLGICTKYNISYEANMALLQSLNPTTNLNFIKTGATLLIPVPASAATTSTATAAVPLTTTTTQTAATGKYYTFNLTGTVNGTYALTVNGQSINSANAGQTVHIVTTPDHGFMLDHVSVVSDTDNSSIQVDSNNNFVMPESNVRVTVVFKQDVSQQPHSVYNSSATQRNVIAMVGGANLTSVEPGQTVKLVLSELPSGTVVSAIYVTTVNPANIAQLTNGGMPTSNFVTVNADYSFVMPTSDVFVTVVLKTT